MNRRTLLQSLGAFALLPLLPRLSAVAEAATSAGAAIVPLKKSLAEWQKLLKSAQ